jgi:hypothetical protein
MAAGRRSSKLAVQRGWEPSRLEEQLWTAAYEQVWPTLRQRLNEPTTKRRECRRTKTIKLKARRA